MSSNNVVHPLSKPLTHASLTLYKACQVGLVPVTLSVVAHGVSALTKGRVGAGVVNWFQKPKVNNCVTRLTEVSAAGVFVAATGLTGVQFLNTPASRVWNK